MTQYQFSDLNTDRTVSNIPPKTRTVKKSPLAARMEKLKINEAFVINDAQMASVAANVYATAKRIGVKVTLRQLPEGVGVWRVRNTNASQTDTERKNETQNGAPAKKRLVKANAAQSQGRGRGRKAA
ncbi:predicted ORF [Xanthomonas phage XacN1]|nr:predicted ORF [Xanthomonas phage XacN1]BBA65716.1 predicted ORF [Xanthomonas phage XacN1]